MTRFQTAVLLVLMVTLVFLATAGILNSTPTYDEYRHFQYGEKLLRLDPERDDASYASKMPISVLNVIPWKIVKCLGWDAWITDLAIDRFAGPDPPAETIKKVTKHVAIVPGKLVTVLFALVLAWLVFTWARELYGVRAGLIALTFYILSPNMLANSNLVTVDLYAALLITLALYLYWKFANLGGLKWTIFSALALGVSQLAKYSCLFLYPIFLLIAAIRSLITAFSEKRGKVHLSPPSLSRAVGISLLFILVSVAVINIGFVFSRTLTPLAQYQFRSSLFQAVQDQLSFIGLLPVPVPYPFLDGVDYVSYQDQTGILHGRIYLLGKLAPTGEGFPGYYLIATLYKAPIAAQIAFWWAIGVYFFRFRKERFARDEVFLLVPIVFFAVYFNFFFRTQIGMRFFIVVLPLCHVFLSHLLQDQARVGVPRKVAIGFLIGYQAISVVSYFPHFLSYFNELVTDRRMAYRILADSNLDWGQNRWYLDRYRAAHPEAIVSPETPVAGTIVVPVNDLVGIADPEKYRWLRENFEPQATIAHSYLIFDVSPEALQQAVGERPRAP